MRPLALWGLEAIAPRPRKGPAGKVIVCRGCGKAIPSYIAARWHLCKHLSLTQKELDRIDVIVQGHVVELRRWAWALSRLIKSGEDRGAEIREMHAGRPLSPFDHGFGPLLFARLPYGQTKWMPEVANVPEPFAWEGGRTYDSTIGGAA